ncbi:serine/threonine protein phosphatase 2A 55 kDa regulatory subunit B beta isoform-like [Prosopis cineraria]|uniref:serine/threonine protein phosphatase 2A 55 kDa regulatory subunit B beta isoform-like n=1 Tax=Prosopis cineraria TaxID=364024 RepID=UPI00240FA3FD|nr:serine/threonine protein phosphatase 2A 55 kDa regulatory subunit B beta isoform-like [Prosopis cineraria]
MFQSSSSLLQSNFYQILGDRPPADQFREAIQFEKHGDYLAIGDQGGRVVIFEKGGGKIKLQYTRKFLEDLDSAPARRPKSRYLSEFQSHEPEVDCFRNVEVTERIKKVNWCIAQNGLLLILSANNKTIKLWMIKERKAEKIEEVAPHRFLTSENVLLSHKRFMNGQETQSSSNGYHLEWIENLYREDPPSQDIDDDDYNSLE